MRLFILFSVFMFSVLSCADQECNDSNVESCIKEITAISDSLEKRGEIERSVEVFIDSMKCCVRNVSLKNQVFQNINGQTISIGQANKPTVLIVSSRMCSACIALIPALNQIAEDYEAQANFVLLLGEEYEAAKGVQHKYNSTINLIPSVNDGESSNIVINGFKHLLGYPATYYIDKDSKIVELHRGATAPREPSDFLESITFEEANAKNYDRMKSKLIKLIE